jgi:hypothetical protein
METQNKTLKQKLGGLVGGILLGATVLGSSLTQGCTNYYVDPYASISVSNIPLDKNDNGRLDKNEMIRPITKTLFKDNEKIYPIISIMNQQDKDNFRVIIYSPNGSVCIDDKEKTNNEEVIFGNMSITGKNKPDNDVKILSSKCGYGKYNFSLYVDNILESKAIIEITP